MKRYLKIINILMLLFFTIGITGCYNLKDEFLEPEGYTITYIRQDNRGTYGYVKNEDLSRYMNSDKSIDKIQVLYPYNDSRHSGQLVIVDVSKIESITVGVYKELR